MIFFPTVGQGVGVPPCKNRNLQITQKNRLFESNVHLRSVKQYFVTPNWCCIYQTQLHPWKLTWHWKIPIFKRKYILQMVDFPIVMSGFFFGRKTIPFSICYTSEKKNRPHPLHRSLNLQKGNTIQQHLGIFPIASMQGGPLLVVSRVITPINGLVTG